MSLLTKNEFIQRLNAHKNDLYEKSDENKQCNNTTSKSLRESVEYKQKESNTCSHTPRVMIPRESKSVATHISQLSLPYTIKYQ